MSLRNRDIIDPSATRTAQMVRVAITDDTIYAIWRVPKSTGPDEQRVECSPALVANLFGRVAFNTLLDNIATDTQNRINQ